MISLILARAQNGVIGLDNRLPWHLPEDLRIFKTLTLNKTIIMGRKTWESLPKRPLPQRHNVIITRQGNLGNDYNNNENIQFCTMDGASQMANGRDCFVIGGAEIYRQFVNICHTIYISQLQQSFDGTAFFDETLLAPFSKRAEKPFPNATIPFTLQFWQKKYTKTRIPEIFNQL